MAGRHESPTSRSYWVSVTTWTAKRVVILVLAVILGAWVLKNGFPSNASDAITGAVPRSAAASTSPGPSESPRSSPHKTRKPKIKGVVVQVLNGGAPRGRAGLVTDVLKAAGYTTRDPGDTGQTPTTVYYAKGSRIDAGGLQAKYFPAAPLRSAPATFERDVDVTVVLGADFSDLAPSSPSP